MTPANDARGVAQPIESGFYLDGDEAPLQQGDLVLAPVVRLASGTAPDTQATGLLDKSAEQFAQVPAIVAPPSDELGSNITAQVGWGPALVVSHDCQLDKDFNRRYRELREEGMSKNDAIRVAELDPNLDRWVMVAPVVEISPEPGDNADIQRSIAMHRGDIVGLFPVPANARVGVAEGVAELTWVSTIDRHTIVARLASMTNASRAKFRLALARTVALRTPELGFELEDIVGDRIDGARRAADSPLVVELTLRQTGTVLLMTPPGDPPLGGPARTTQ